MSVSLDDQWKELQRELAMRKRLYPQWISNGTLHPKAAAERIAALEAAAETVREARMRQSMTSVLTGKPIE